MKKNLLLSFLAILFVQSFSLNAQCTGEINYLSDNLLSNPGFERGNIDINSDLEYIGDCTDNSSDQLPEFYSVPFSGAAAFNCNSFWSTEITAVEGGRYMIIDLPVEKRNVKLWCQKIEVISNSEYEFSAQFINVFNPVFNDSDPEIRVVVEGNSTTEETIFDNTDSFTINEGRDWTKGTGIFNSEENTEVKICIQNINFGHNGNDLGIDDLSIRQYECTTNEETETETEPNISEATFLDCDETIEEYSASLLNGGFEEGNYFLFEDGAINVDESQIDGWRRAAFSRNIDIIDSGNQGIPAYEGDTYVEINSFAISTLYQDLATVPGDVLAYSFAHRGRDGVDLVGVYFGTPKGPGQEPDQTELVNAYATDSDRWVIYEGKYEIPAGQTVTRFSLGALQSSDDNLLTGNLIDAVTVQSIQATCENPMRGNIEICTNGIDDDNDGLIDDADPDCNTSGGNEGGLESNGRLAEKIFARNLGRRIEPSLVKNNKKDMVQKNRTASYGVFGQANQRSLLSVEDFIPIDTLNNTETFISSPADLQNITNATEVFSVDIFRDDVRLAAVFATTTEKGVYEHTKYICDRLKGGIINDLQTVHIGYADFIVADLYQPEGNREYALSFSARENKEGYFNIQSHWSLENYPTDDSYYNFQIWAGNLEDLKTLTLKTMQLLHEYKPVVSMTTTPPPSVFVSQGEYANGKLNLKIINKTGSKNIKLVGEKTATETTSKESISAQANISGNYSEFVSLEVGSVYDMGFRVRHDNDTVFDDLFIADGLWFIDTKDGNIQYDVVPSEEEADQDVYPLERSIIVTGSIENNLNVYRSMKPNFRSVDVSDYNTLHFNVSGAQSMQIVFIKESVTDWEAQYKTSITTTGASNEIQIPLSRFANGSGEAINLNDVQAIIFKIEGEEGTKEVNIEISELDFRNEEDTLAENAFANNDMIITPNPASGNVNVQWISDSEGSHVALLLDTNGRVLGEYSGLTSRGHNQIMIERKSLAAGMYFFNIIEQTGEIKSDRIVLID